MRPFSLLFLLPAAAHAGELQLARDPVAPSAGEQYKLTLVTTQPCYHWVSATPQLRMAEQVVSSSRKMVEGAGCVFEWVVFPPETPSDEFPHIKLVSRDDVKKAEPAAKP